MVTLPGIKTPGVHLKIIRNPKRTVASQRERKSALRKLLAARDPVALKTWASREPHAVRTLFAALFETDVLLRWRAIEGLGWIAGDAARSDPERVRDWIRRILWNMMEESGGLMWHGPEAIGEILANAPSLIPEYLGPLGSYRVEEPFEAGTYLALARIAAVAPDAVSVIAEVLLPGLTDPDPRIRAHAALALGRIGHAAARPGIAALLVDETPITTYDTDTGELHATSVGALARSIAW